MSAPFTDLPVLLFLDYLLPAGNDGEGEPKFSDRGEFLISSFFYLKALSQAQNELSILIKKLAPIQRVRIIERLTCMSTAEVGEGSRQLSLYPTTATEKRPQERRFLRTVVGCFKAVEFNRASKDSL